MYFSSSKDKNHILATIAFYGVIEEILEIDYVIFKASLFKWKWVPNSNYVQTNELGFTHVDIGKETYNIESLIMSTQEKTSFLSDRPCRLIERFSIILKGKHIPHSDDESFDISSTPSYET